jgi:hypothetical protein
VATCDSAADVEFPACHLNAQDWGVPVDVEAADGPANHALVLPLAG